MELTNQGYATPEEKMSLLNYYYQVTDESDLSHLLLHQAAQYLATKKKIEKYEKRRDLCREIVKRVLK
jgi:hypothetical protein